MVTVWCLKTQRLSHVFPVAGHCLFILEQVFFIICFCLLEDAFSLFTSIYHLRTVIILSLPVENESLDQHEFPGCTVKTLCIIEKIKLYELDSFT